MCKPRNHVTCQRITQRLLSAHFVRAGIIHASGIIYNSGGGPYTDWQTQSQCYPHITQQAKQTNNSDAVVMDIAHCHTQECWADNQDR